MHVGHTYVIRLSNFNNSLLLANKYKPFLWLQIRTNFNCYKKMNWEVQQVQIHKNIKS